MEMDSITKKVVKDTLQSSLDIYSNMMLKRALAHFTLGETASLVVDRPNMFWTFKKLGFYWDPEVIFNVLRSAVVLKSIYWFTGLTDTPENQIVAEECNILRRHGVRVITKLPNKKETKVLPDGKIVDRFTANMDTDICCTTLMECDKVDNIILACGDSDFVPLFKAIRSRGQRTTLLSSNYSHKSEGRTLSKSLREHADIFIDLNCFKGVVINIEYAQ